MSENPKPNTKDSPSRSETGQRTRDDSSDEDTSLPKRSRDQPSPEPEHAPVEATPSTSQHTAGPSQPQQGGNSGTPGASQAGAAPEAVWMPFIQDVYPDLLSQTYFLPPLHFNLTSHDVQTIAEQRALVRAQPSARGRRVQQPAPPPAQVAGTAFVENDPNIEPVRTQDSDWQDDTAQQCCLQALSEIRNQVMIIISNLKFQNYLNNHPNPQYAAAIARLPSINHASIPQYIADGECDIVIIHRRYGLLIGEIKSLGGGSHFGQQPPSQQTQILTRKLEGPKGALQQIRNQETALKRLLSDLPPVTITKMLLLPNISAQQLRTALHTSPSLLRTLCQTMSVSQDGSLAVRHCLCEEDLQRPDSWWQMLHTGGSDPAMTDGLYKRLVARFCGPATTVDVPTAGLPRKVLRSPGEAVAETGLRFSSLTLTPGQVALLNTQPEPQFLHLSGPPGTGKTVVLLLKALQGVQQGRQVVIVSGRDDSRAVSLLLEEQLRSMAGPAAANLVHRLCCDFPWPLDVDDVRAEVTRLQRTVRPGPVLVICDEFDPNLYAGYIPWLREVRARLPAVTVWTAGIWSHDAPWADLPSWVQVETLQEALRCPPSVTAVLQQSDQIQGNIVPRYTAPQVAVATQGPPVQRLQHRGQPGHSDGHPLQCVACADNVEDILCQLRVGQRRHTLQFRDVLILCTDTPSADDVMARRLRQHHRLPVAVISDLSSQAELRELALAVTDEIIMTESTAVQGLERRLVVVLGGDDLPSCSRCSSALYIIE